MDARTSKRQKRISKKQEEKVAEQLNGKTQANSGATRLGGGADVRVGGSDPTRVECKYTEAKQYTLRLDDLRKVRLQAINGGLELPVMHIQFKSVQGLEEFAVIPWDYYLELQEIYRDTMDSEVQEG